MSELTVGIEFRFYPWTCLFGIVFDDNCAAVVLCFGPFAIAFNKPEYWRNGIIKPFGSQTK